MLINLEARVDNGSDPGAVREKVAGSLEQRVVRGRAGRDAKVTGMTERVQERTRLLRWLGFSILLALSSNPQRPAGGGPAAAGRAQLTPALCPPAVRKQKAHTLQGFIQSVPSVLSSEASV